jgi:natural product precursor
MKKLKLKLAGVNEMLSREQMKKINGGYDDRTYICNCLGGGVGSNFETDTCEEAVDQQATLCLENYDLPNAFCLGPVNAIGCSV